MTFFAEGVQLLGAVLAEEAVELPVVVMELPREGLQVLIIRRRMDKNMAPVHRSAAALTKRMNVARTMHALSCLSSSTPTAPCTPPWSCLQPCINGTMSVHAVFRAHCSWCA
jgi:hypothetical protein